jgi:hypothetical protein
MFRTTIVGTALLAAVTLTATAASAATFHDPAQDGSYASTVAGTHGSHLDIRKVVVKDGSRAVFRMYLHGLTRYDLTDRGYVNLTVDTDRSGPGAEYRFHGKFGRIGFQKAAGGWHDVGCRGGRVSLSFSKDLIGFSLPRGCIGKPAEVRVHLETWWIRHDGATIYDELPAAGGPAWTRWVRH